MLAVQLFWLLFCVKKMDTQSIVLIEVISMGRESPRGVGDCCVMGSDAMMLMKNNLCFRNVNNQVSLFMITKRTVANKVRKRQILPRGACCCE